ncbi:hypothetical protein K466DRAFT_472786, partial [Polyporus arcularius HHB13444]
MGDFDDLLHVLISPGFDISHLENFSAKKAEKILDSFEDADGVFSANDGWMRSDVFVSLPKTHSAHKTESSAPQLAIPGVVHRSLLELCKGVVTDKTTRHTNNYHWRPHQLWWYPPDAPEESSHPVRVYTDCYNSEAMLEEDKKLRMQARNPADDPAMDYCILPLLIWSDATHLSDFGHASLWPIYVYLGNLSKYVRGRPTEFAAQHLAYIPDLPDSFKHEYMRAFDTHRPPSDEAIKFCRRELYTQIWNLLLDDDFMRAYEHGFVVKCGDGVVRRLFPRVFTYSADYPEK